MVDLDERFRTLSKVRTPDLWADIEIREPGHRPTRSPRRWPAAVVAFVVAVAGLTFAVTTFRGGTGGSPLTTAVTNGLIAFSRGGAHGGISVMNADGTGLRSLTSQQGDDHPAWSPDGSRLAFVRYARGAAGIYVMNADGSDQTQLTTDDAGSSPSWSPDGNRIALALEVNHNAEITVMNADGTDLTPISDDPLLEYTPAWSPDGTRIAFSGFTQSEAGPPSFLRVYVMNADGSDIHPIGADDAALPDWSPDGSRLVFVNTSTGSLWVIDADGGHLHELVDLSSITRGRGNLTTSPRWSPDGSMITFASGPTAKESHVYVANADGTGLRQLTGERIHAASPSWQSVIEEPSPTIAPPANGRIAFAWYDGSSYQIYAANPDGTEVQEVTHMGISVSNPTWSPDGSKIAFQGETVGGEGGRLDIYIANADGTGVVQLTHGPDSYQHPSWSPDGAKIAATRWSNGHGDVVLLPVDGSGETVVTQSRPGDSWGPVWSPDGARLAYISNRDANGDLNDDIWVIHADGTGAYDVTGSSAYDRDPTWSPDGSKIAFFRGPEGSPDLAVTDVEGTEVHSLASSVSDGGEPAWSPDGTQIAFVKDDSRLGTGRLEIVDVVSGEATQPLDLVGVGSPAWQPVRGEPKSSPSSAAIGSRWTRLPDPPGPTSGAAMVWTGTELLSWGGYRASDDSDVADGYRFDPSTRTWSALPPAPAGRTGALALWTGSEAIFWGGWDRRTVHADGFAFDPTNRTWSSIPSAPITPAYGTVAVWTGREILAWGGGKSGEPSNVEGAAYDPSSETWRRIADAPIGSNSASAVWTGDEMIVFGSLLNGRNHAATATAVGAAYDPSTDGWKQLPASDLSPQASAAVWTGDRLVAFDYGWKAEMYLPGVNAWRPLPDLRFNSGECYPDGVFVGTEVFAFGCGEAATLAADDVWRPVRGGMTEATVTANAGTYKLWRFATLVPAGDVLFLLAEGITVNQGAVCYGCAGSPTSFWAYRP